MTPNALDRTVRLIEPLGTPEFFHMLYAECEALIEHDQCNVFYFDQAVRPVCLFTLASDESQSRITRSFAQQYVDYGFRLDPVLRDLAPALRQHEALFIRHQRAHDIFDAKYRQTFYATARAGQKLVLGARANAGTYYLNFYRAPERTSYSEGQVATLSEIGSLLCQLVAKHHRLTLREALGYKGAAEAAAAPLAHIVPAIRRALLESGAQLTAREAEICSAIAVGMTTAGISLKLGISANTVATHRKRAYAKLGISSQNELFLRYYTAAGRHLVLGAGAWGGN